MCLEEGKVTPATDVHHINHISQAGSRLEAYDIGYDSNNLQSLCRYHHMKIHAHDHHLEWVTKKQQNNETR